MPYPPTTSAPAARRPWLTIALSAAVSVALVLALFAVFLAARSSDSGQPAQQPDAVVGAWLVHAPDAPFTQHVFLFHADHTMQQANPDAGDTNTSDSDGGGTWRRDGNSIRGKFVEITAERLSGQFATRGEIQFDVTVTGDTFTGNAGADFFDEAGQHLRGPLPTSLNGERVTL